MTSQSDSASSRGGLTARFLVALYLPPLFVFGVAMVAAAWANVPIKDFTRDPVQIVGVPFYIGSLSNLGMFVWAAAATAALLAAGVLPRTAATAERRSFFLWSGLLTLMLGGDDVLMFHDTIAPNYLHVRDQIVLFGYVCIGVAYVYRFRREIFRADIALLVLAAAFVCTSLLLDQWHMFYVLFGRMVVPESHLVEDGAKLLAQATWLGYLARRASDALRGELPAAS